MIYYKTGNITKEKQHEEAYNLLLHALSNEYGIDRLPQIAKTDKGKPYFTDCDIFFNVSHTEDGVACVIAESECGIDIQSIATSTKAARKVCAPAEKVLLDQAEDKNRLFTRYWALKEAYVKCTGTGITVDLTQLDFSECIKNDFMHKNMHFTIVENDKFVLVCCIYRKF